jgi:Flp pilus assembly protein TadG
MMRHLPNRLLHDKRRAGNIMLEFAIGSGILLAAFTGTFEFGYTFYRYNALATAVANGARYASLRPYDSANSTPSSGFTDAVQNIVVYGDPAGGSVPIVPGLKTSNVTVTPVFAFGVPSSITVSITGYTIDAVVAQTTFTGKPSVTYPYTGIYSPY